MMRRQQKTSELKSSSLSMSVHKYDMTNLKQSAKQHWNVQNIQPFFPAIEKLFKTDTLETVQLYGIRFPEEAISITNPTTIRTTQGRQVEVHRKTTMLLSPYKMMRGNYGTAFGLPTSSETASNVSSKLQNPNTSGYVGSIISAALSNCRHFPKVYGIFSAIADEHSVDISDDYGEISERPWFSQNIGKLFEIKLSDIHCDDVEFRHTRSAKSRIDLGDSIELNDIPELSPIVVDSAHIADMKYVPHDVEEIDDMISESSSVSTQDIFDIESCDCDTDDEYESILEDDSGEPFAWATFRNVPVQITLLEKCDGTLYELLMMHQEPEKHIAWITQVMFALAYAQRTIGLTHNDLHANNVMYVPCEKEYLYYSSGGQLYKVPTYGYLIKIIDFERGIASIKLTGMKEPKLFISDHYHLDEEAAGMFNYGDYYNSKYPEIKPNPSGDLVRLATSLYWDLFPENDDSILCQLFKKWLTIEDGSVMFGKKNPHHDRYHGFELYKAIVRFCKDTAIPRRDILLVKHLYGVDSGGEDILLID